MDTYVISDWINYSQITDNWVLQILTEIDNMTTRKEILISSLALGEGVAFGFKNTSTSIFLRITHNVITLYQYRHNDPKQIRQSELIRFPNI